MAVDRERLRCERRHSLLGGIFLGARGFGGGAFFGRAPLPRGSMPMDIMKASLRLMRSSRSISYWDLGATGMFDGILIDERGAVLR